VHPKAHAARSTTPGPFLASLNLPPAGHAQLHHLGDTAMQIAPSAKVKEMPTHARAKARITVQSSQATPWDQTTTPSLLELHLTEAFTGDLDGQSPVRALQLLRDDQSATLVSLQRFTGQLNGRRGTFVLQGSEIVESGKIRATWFVVPGSGTDALTHLRGQGGFEGQFGEGSEAWLDYWFE
jgi:hypothetical protein